MGFQLNHKQSQRGIGLLEMALMILVLGMTSVVAVMLYDRYEQFNRQEMNKARVERVQSAMNSFIQERGRLPAPAPITAAPDTADYGSENSVFTAVTAAAAVTPVAGTQVTALGRDPDGAGPLANRVVRIGTIPTRTLNLPDEYMLDAWGNRMVYAVTQDYMITQPPAPAVSAFAQDFGGIFIQDAGVDPATGMPTGAPNSSTATAGNAIYSIVAPGADKRGAYSADGVISSPCGGPAHINDNCFDDPTPDAVFVNTMSMKGDASTASGFAHSIKYKSGKDKYSWRRTPLTPCDQVCGPGNETYTWRCLNAANTEDITGAKCLIFGPRPPNDIVACNMGACTWYCGDLNSALCNSSCRQECTPECRAPNGTPAPGRCSGAYAGLTSQPCTGGACCTCGPPTGTCGETYADSCGNAGACTNPNTPVCGAPTGTCGGTYADSCGNVGACTNPNTPVCGAAPGVCPSGTNYPDSCGNSVCPCPACVPTCGAPTGTCGGTYADSCGNPNGCTNPNTPTCGAQPAVCVGTYPNSCGANVCPCSPVACAAPTQRSFISVGETYPDMQDGVAISGAELSSVGIQPGNFDVSEGDIVTVNYVGGRSLKLDTSPVPGPPTTVRSYVFLYVVDGTTGEISIVNNPIRANPDAPGASTITYTVERGVAKIGFFVFTDSINLLPSYSGRVDQYYRYGKMMGPTGQRQGRLIDPANDLMFVYDPLTPPTLPIIAPYALSSYERGSPFNINRNDPVGNTPILANVSAPMPGDPTTLRVAFEDFANGADYSKNDLDANDIELTVRIQDRVAPIDATCPLYAWRIQTPYPACNAACQSSMPLARTVECVRTHDNVVVANGMCNPYTIPKTLDLCQNNSTCGCVDPQLNAPGCQEYGWYQYEEWWWGDPSGPTEYTTPFTGTLFEVSRWYRPGFTKCCDDCARSCFVNGYGYNCGTPSDYTQTDNEVQHFCGTPD